MRSSSNQRATVKLTICFKLEEEQKQQSGIKTPGCTGWNFEGPVANYRANTGSDEGADRCIQISKKQRLTRTEARVEAGAQMRRCSHPPGGLWGDGRVGNRRRCGGGASQAG